MFKTIAFILIFSFVIPAGAVLASRYQTIRTTAFSLMLGFTCLGMKIHLAPLPEWRGASRGFAFTMVDIFAAMLFVGFYLDRTIKKRFFPPGAWSYLLYLGLTIASIVNTIYVQQWGFEILKMLWMYIFFVVSYNFIIHYKNLWQPVYVICVIVIGMFLVGLYQKYLSGSYYQIPSTMPHQNSLSLYIALFGCLILGVMLNEKLKQWQIGLLAFSFLCTVLLNVFTYSRGGLFCYMFGIAITGSLSILLNGLSTQKIGFITFGVIGGLMVFGYASPRIIQRFTRAPEASKNTRIFLARAALRMAQDYTLGVGANNFSAYSGPGGKYAIELYQDTRITDKTEPFGGIVETIYLLVAAECGWITMAALLLWFGYYLVLAGLLVTRLRHCPGFGIAIGIFAGLCANFSQSLIEWSLKQYGNFYQLMFIFALTGAIWVKRSSLIAQKTTRPA